MTRGAARASKKVESEDSDSDTDVEMSSQSQATAGPSQRSQSQSQAEPVSNTRKLETLVSDVVTYMLIADMKKSTLKRPDIIKHALKDCGKDFPVVFNAAKKKLMNVFGVEVHELPEKKGQYILVNQLDVNVENPHMVWSDKENSHCGLVSLILSMIYMNGNILAESELWPALNKLGIDIEVPHKEFGDVQKLITRDFVRQHYLEYKRIPNSDPAIFEFAWGPRAFLEAGKKEILNVVCGLYGNVKPEDFAEQFAEASQMETH